MGFSGEDYAGVSFPHTDALVITLTITNHNIHRILVDNGSSAHILCWPAFMYMDISSDKIVPARYPLMGFAGEEVQPVDSIKLLVTAGEPSRQKTIMVKFLLVDHPSACNAILGRVAFNEQKAITSTSHWK